MRSRWVILRRASNSGKVLFFCRSCERISQTPDKICPYKRAMDMNPGTILSRSLKQDGQHDCHLWEETNKEKLTHGGFCHISTHRHSSPEEAEMCKEAWKEAQEVLHQKVVDLIETGS
jgi:hypothetical protein